MVFRVCIYYVILSIKTRYAVPAIGDFPCVVKSFLFLQWAILSVTVVLQNDASENNGLEEGTAPQYKKYNED